MGRKIPIPTPLPLLHKISQKHAVPMKLGTNKPCTNAFQKTYHLFPLVLLFIFQHGVITFFLRISNFLEIYYIFSSSVGGRFQFQLPFSSSIKSHRNMLLLRNLVLINLGLMPSRKHTICFLQSSCLFFSMTLSLCF